MKKTVVLAQPIHSAGSSVLHQRDDIEVIELNPYSEEAFKAAIARAHAVILRVTPLPAEMIAAAPHLEIVSRHGVGYDAVDLEALNARNIPLVIATDGNKISVAELAFSFLLSLAKNQAVFDGETRVGRYNEVRAANSLFDVAGKTLFVVGFGRIGQEIAPRAKAFDMTVTIYDPLVDDSVITAAGYTPVASLEEGLRDADAVTLHCPKNADTVDLLNTKTLAMMKPGSLVINCARGGLVNEAALFEALKSGHIGGAGLDVFVDEPTPGDHPLFNLNNLIVSPHVGGMSNEAAQRSSYRSAQNVLDLFDGKLNPEVVVNPEVLPR